MQKLRKKKKKLSVAILKFKMAAININKWGICQMLYLENYKWELYHFKICVSYVKVSKYDKGKFYIEFILCPIKMFTLLRIKNLLFSGKKTNSMENLLMLAKISLCHILGNYIFFATASFYGPNPLVELTAAIAIEKN